MKDYKRMNIRIIIITYEDVITTSGTPQYDDNGSLDNNDLIYNDIFD